ncbi:MAG: hypothetical protein N3D10_00980 [Candidatus Micrarchaeota archaeon]|nr:hypothetical protein [Candidatus Micrarchaeota archaeon]
MFGWAIATGKKLIAIFLAFLITYSVGPNYFQKELLDFIFLAFLVGMVLPDLDLITNFLKNFIHWLAIFLFILGSALIIFYPSSINIANNVCVSITEPIAANLTVYCNIIFLGILLVFFYIIARMIVGFIPSENFMHSYFALILVSLGCYIFLFFLLGQQQAILLSIVFFGSYFIHLAIDSSYHYHKN